MFPASPTSQINIVVALLQPSPETYEIYDDIMLMGDGKVGQSASGTHCWECAECGQCTF